ncbi:hypothetical protein NEOC95_002218 [Neochlamydia sp. AcF95]|nr:hypothetical protein [Neochlamydia sp. AcF95]
MLIYLSSPQKKTSLVILPFFLSMQEIIIIFKSKKPQVIIHLSLQSFYH